MGNVRSGLLGCWRLLGARSAREELDGVSCRWPAVLRKKMRSRELTLQYLWGSSSVSVANTLTLPEVAGYGFLADVFEVLTPAGRASPPASCGRETSCFVHLTFDAQSLLLSLMHQLFSVIAVNISRLGIFAGLSIGCGATVVVRVVRGVSQYLFMHVKVQSLLFQLCGARSLYTLRCACIACGVEALAMSLILCVHLYSD